MLQDCPLEALLRILRKHPKVPILVMFSFLEVVLAIERVSRVLYPYSIPLSYAWDLFYLKRGTINEPAKGFRAQDGMKYI